MTTLEVSLLWPDGKTTTGRTWEDAEEALRSAQWVPYKTKRAFRRDMRRRAKIWSGTRVSRGSSSRDFLLDLQDAGLFRVRVTTDEGESE